MTNQHDLETTADESIPGHPFLVIGGTGKTGRRVAAQLVEAGRPVRVVSRSAGVRFDWDEPATWAPAVEGARAAYVVPPEQVVDMDRFTTTVAEAGLERLVLLSARQPDQGGDGVLPAVEAALAGGPVPVTMVRPAWFAQNFTEGFFNPEHTEGVLRLPVGDGAEPFIDTADIAAVAIAALTGDAHEGEAYDLSGPELLTFDEAVDRLGSATGRPFRFEAVSPDAWAAEAADFLPPPVIELLLNLFAGIRNGDNAYLSPGVEQALARPPRSFVEALS